MKEELVTDKQLAEWLVDTCLLFGMSVGGAYKVAGLFVEAVNAR